MKSHEYAQKLRTLAAALDAAPAFELPDYSDIHYERNGLESFNYYGDKARFLAAVKAIGNARKIADEYDFRLVALDGLLTLSVTRDAVCRLVKPAQPAEYECEPLLTQAEMMAAGVASNGRAR